MNHNNIPLSIFFQREFQPNTPQKLNQTQQQLHLDLKITSFEQQQQTPPPKFQTLIFQSNKVNPTPTPVPSTGKHLPNGDLYTGDFLGNVPNGYGKYLWLDGSMYEGEWKKGKAYGKGKFSWPSGATYEGEFKSGRMEGYGVFTGAEGDTYRGNWVSDRKHGYGEKRYANGDYFEGDWKRDLQDGWGRYVWRNGNEYSGDWKNGVVCGKGLLRLSNGMRFHGVWDNGVLKKSDFCCGKKFDGNGNGNGVERVVPKICVWESEGENITCDILDKVEAASMFYGDKFMETGLDQSPFVGRNNNGNGKGNSDRHSFIKETKKPGQTISKGHKNYDLMLNLQLGVRYSVGKHASILRDLKQSDFDPKEKFWTRFPTEGSKITPPHQSNDFKWKDYCPIVFRHLRDLFQVDPANYMLAICGNDALRELSSPGKSGSSFYLTQDDRFMIKTVKKSEVKVLLRMLPNYYQHVRRYENSLLTRFYGVHCVKPANGPKTRFIVMGNLFCSENQIHRRFDLKGSRHGRTIEKAEDEIDETTTLKDLDLNFVFRLETNWYQDLIKQIERDCEFLEAERIMDYSLLVGVHFRDNNTGDNMGLSPFLMRCETDSFQNHKNLRELQNMDGVLAGRKPLMRLGANTPAKAERLTRRSDFDQYIHGSCGNLTSSSHEVVLYFGIIDILQDYDISKRLEHAYKSLHADPTTISAVDPKHYSKRFQDFIGRIFVKDR